MTLDTLVATRWTAVCPYPALEPERGAAALVGGVQVAIFRTHDGELFALDNRDPATGAYVMSRGIVGTRGEAPTVASPLHKQVYDLRTGRCLDDPALALATYPVRRGDGGLVEVAVPGRLSLSSVRDCGARSALPAFRSDRVPREPDRNAGSSRSPHRP